MKFLTFLFVRVSSVFVVQTFFVPDEYWQSLEVAHHISFGNGFLTWEWKRGIRSWIQPLVIAVVYKFLRLLNLDSPELVVLVPRLLQACLTAYAEWQFCSTVGKKLDRKLEKITGFLTLASWYLYYVGSRTIANSLETSLVLLALSSFLKSNLNKCLVLAGISCYLRPTAGALWIPLCGKVATTLYKERKLASLLQPMLNLSAVITLFTAIDSYMYGRFVLVPVEFLKFNFLSNLSDFYGTHSWHWYWTNALPSVTGFTLILVILTISGFARQRRTADLEVIRLLLASVVSYVGLHSIVAHKEIRFVTPVIPLLNVIGAFSLKNFRSSWKTFYVVLLLATNIPAALFFGMRHQRGVLDVVKALAADGSLMKDDGILFLMPCHSTPLYSHLHKDVSARFLTCEPDFNQAPNYVDEADQFYKNPQKWLKVYPLEETARYIVMYDKLLQEVSPILKSFQYNLKETFFHTDLPEGRVGKYVLLFEKSS